MTDVEREEPSPFRIPAEHERIGRFSILGTLGRGGMGTVLEAFDRTLDRRVAVKVLHREVDEAHGQRLVLEAQAMAKLSHPNVVQVYEVGRAGEQTFVVMELVRGQTLGDWMRTSPTPSWRQCVEMFLRVGQGLAAAHARGMVHRDFKPSNAIVDEQGRPRVLDFGLVRRLSPREDGAQTIESSSSMEHDTASTAPLTVTGTVLGTPAYMPPEQIRGGEADERSDQFSFCVSLYEALYGERPYSGSSMAALMLSVTSGEARAAPKASTVPVELRRVVLRGLAADPAQRWETIDALLAALGAVLVPSRRRWVVLGTMGAVLAMGLGLAVGMERNGHAVDDPCGGAPQSLEGAWDETRRREVHSALLGTELSFAAPTWERVEERLDDYVRVWSTAYTEACEATRVRHEQSDEAMDLRMGCLREHLGSLRSTTSLLARADADVVPKAVGMVSSLPEPELCADVARLREVRQRVPPPDEAEVVEAVVQVRDALLEIRVEHDAGHYAEGLEHVEPLVEQALALGYVPLIAEAKYWRGALRLADSRYPAAEQDLMEAHALATQVGHDLVVGSASMALTELVGHRLARFDEGLLWGKISVSQAIYEQDARRLAKSRNTLGTVYRRKGSFEDALEQQRQALEIRERALGPEHVLVAHSLHALGGTLYRLGDYPASEEHYRRAIETMERALGPGHPQVGLSEGGLAGVLRGQGRLEEAEAHLRRALAIQESALGSDHVAVAKTRDNLGGVLFRGGRLDDAQVEHRRALEIFERALGPEHPDLARTLDNLGNVLMQQGRFEAAERRYRRTMKIRKESFGEVNDEFAMSVDNVGMALHSQGRLEEAEHHHRRAVELMSEALGAEHPMLAISLANLGNVLMERQRHGDAEQIYRRAAALHERTVGAEHPRTASDWSSLGHALLEQGAHEEARRWLRRAYEVHRRALGEATPQTVDSRMTLARAELALGEIETAIEHAEGVVSVVTSSSWNAGQRADARFVLAQALWADRGQRARARSFAEQAREDLRGAGPGVEPAIEQVERWIRLHRR